MALVWGREHNQRHRAPCGTRVDEHRTVAGSGHDAIVRQADWYALGAFRAVAEPGRAIAHRVTQSGFAVHRNGVRYLADDGGTVVGPGHMSFYRAGDLIRMEAVNAGGIACDWIAFDERQLPGVVEAFAPELARPGIASLFAGRHVRVSAGRYLRQRQAFRGFAAGMPVDGSSEDRIVDAVADAFAALSDHAMRAGDAAPLRNKRAVRARRLVERAKALLEATYAQDWTLAGLAEQVHSSRFHLARTFRAETGCSVHDYLTELRVRHALVALEAGECRIGRLALSLGFSSHSHLSAVFAARFGLSPSECGRRFR